MPAMPRIITVDPSGTISRIIRSAMDLFGYQVALIDVPRGAEAVDELHRGGAHLVVTAWELYDEMQGLPLALTIKQQSPDTAVVILSDVDDPESLDEETEGEPPFVYMHRPVDLHVFLRVLMAALNGENIIEAAKPVEVVSAPPMFNHGRIPPMDQQNARNFLLKTLSDTGARAVVLANRAGEIIVDEGRKTDIDRALLVQALVHSMISTIEMSSLAGGQAQTMQFYDSDTVDVFVFSVGLHHFLAIVYDGQAGGRQFGNVRSVGRRVVQDLIALLGASAFAIHMEKPAQDKPEPVMHKRKTGPLQKVPEVEKIELVRPEPVAAAEPEPMRMEAIQGLDFNIFDQLGSLEDSAADDLFSLDNMAALVSGSNGRKAISMDEAMELGVLPNLEDQS
jgi:DNA-binding NarL/FixJ family response regulator